VRSTSGLRTAGVQVGLALPQADDRLTGSAHLRGGGDALQSEPPAKPIQNRTDHIIEAGASAGAPIGSGWLWGSAGLTELKQDALTGHPETLRTTSLAGKGRIPLGQTSISLLALHTGKTDDDRDTSFDSSYASRWRQSSPATLLALAARRPFGTLALDARAAWLGASANLDPHGGMAANVYQDGHGVYQGSYQKVDSDRDRLQASAELSGSRGWFGHVHELLVGGGYRRASVETVSAWPGNKVLGFEEQTVFFRAFRLTGFALPRRDEHARTTQDEVELFAQDAVRLGRFDLSLGLRLDRVAGRNEASQVGANPIFPELLPAVSYGGGATEIRWLDLLPRVGVRFTVDPRLALAATYSEYAGPLGAGAVAFDNPIGRGYASLAYYWNDRNADHVVEPGELDERYGQLSASGLDPENPGAASSPHAIAEDLRAPRTREATLALTESLGRALAFTLRASIRRTRDVTWSPLRGLTSADYAATGAVSGTLFGDPYAVTYFAPATLSGIVPGNGQLLANRDGYRQDAFVLTAAFDGHIGERVRWQAWGAFSDWREHFEDRSLAIQDPTPTDVQPLVDDGVLAVHPGGLGRDEVFVSARWSAGGTLAATLPARLELGAIVHARDGFPIPYFEVGLTGDPTGSAKNVLIAPRLDSFRLPGVVLLDARLARAFVLGHGRLTAAFDVFNLLNHATPLQVVRDIELPAFDRARETMRPRMVKLGLEFRF
jgi:hypothetical protein